MEACTTVITVQPTGMKRSALRLAMYVAQGGRCWYCDCVMRLYPAMTGTGAHPPDYPTFEHISPVGRRGGKKIRPGTPAYLTAIGNQVLVCSACNGRRGARPLTEFIAELRESGLTRGIVARIRHLVDDHTPQPWRASAFEWYMLQALAHPRRPGDSLVRLPASLESAILPDPAEPLPIRRAPAGPPAPKRRAPPFVVRFFRTLWRCTQRLRPVLHRKEAACLKC